MRAKFLLIAALWWVGAAQGGQTEEVDEEILKDFSFFYYMEVAENIEILDAPEIGQKEEPQNEPPQSK